MSTCSSNRIFLEVPCSKKLAGERACVCLHQSYEIVFQIPSRMLQAWTPSKLNWNHIYIHINFSFPILHCSVLFFWYLFLYLFIRVSVSFALCILRKRRFINADIVLQIAEQLVLAVGWMLSITFLHSPAKQMMFWSVFSLTNLVTVQSSEWTFFNFLDTPNAEQAGYRGRFANSRTRPDARFLTLDSSTTPSPTEFESDSPGDLNLLFQKTHSFFVLSMPLFSVYPMPSWWWFLFLAQTRNFTGCAMLVTLHLIQVLSTI